MKCEIELILMKVELFFESFSESKEFITIAVKKVKRLDMTRWNLHMSLLLTSPWPELGPMACLAPCRLGNVVFILGSHTSS